MARKPKAEEHENLERWLVSYADFITLLFAFFVVMYSISSVNEGKYRVLSDSLIAAFHSPNKTLMPIQVGKTTKSPIEEKTKIKQSPFVIKVPEIPLPWTKDVKLKGAGSQRYRSRGAVVDKLLEKLAKEGKVQLTPRQQLALSKALSDGHKAAGTGEAGGPDTVAMKKIAADVQRALQTLISKNLIRVKRNKLWVEVEINDSVLFASGQAAINPKAVDVVKDLAKILAPFPNVVRVEGFTDNVPIDNNVYPSNWELSSARAASVVRMMSHHGIDPRRLLAVGYGKYHPIADNKTVDGRHKNRRVTLVVLAKGASELAIKADPANLRETKGADGGGRPSAHTAVASINPKKKADLTVGSGGHPPSSGGPGRAAPVKRAAPGGKGLQVPPRATAAQGALQGAQGAAVPRRGGLIPPPIQLAAPIKLPTPLGLPMASPLPLPNSAKGKQP